MNSLDLVLRNVIDMRSLNNQDLLYVSPSLVFGTRPYSTVICYNTIFFFFEAVVSGSTMNNLNNEKR